MFLPYWANAETSCFSPHTVSGPDDPLPGAKLMAAARSRGASAVNATVAKAPAETPTLIHLPLAT